MWSYFLVWGLWYFCAFFMLLVFSSSPLFLPRLSIGTVQTMHWRCLRLSRCIPTVSRRTLGTHGDDRHVRTGLRSRIQWLTLVSRLREESVGSPVLPGRLYSKPLQSDTDALLGLAVLPGRLYSRPLQSDHGRSVGAAVLPGRLCSSLHNQTRKLIARGESDAIISLWWH